MNTVHSLRPYRRTRGFTFIEMIVVIALTSLIVGVLGYMLQFFYKTSGYALQASIAVAEARRGVGDAMRYARAATYGSDGSYPIRSAATSSFVFYAKVDSSGSVARVTYLLVGDMFYRGITLPAGSPPSYTGATATTTIASSVVNGTSTPIFRYYDDTGSELLAPVDLSEIASVATMLVIDVNTARAPVAFTLSGGATLRNLLNQQ